MIQRSDKLKMKTDYLLDWLLEKNNFSVRYFTLKLLLDKDDNDIEVRQAKTDILQSIPVTEILKTQREEGYWNHPKKYMNRYNGTYWNLILLLELGVDPKHQSIQKSAKYLLETAFDKSKKGFVNERGTDLPPCYAGYLLWAMLQCNFYNTPEIRDCIDGIISTMQFNDGDTEVDVPDNGCIGKHTCIRGVVPILRAFHELSKTENTASVQKIVDQGKEFLLKHYLYKRSHDLKKVINPRLTKLTFPNCYYPDFLQMLDLLTNMGCRDERMTDAYDALLKKRKEDGKWELERLYNERGKNDLFPISTVLEERNTPSKWVTLKALKVMKNLSKN
jgi:hypothetical protein